MLFFVNNVGVVKQNRSSSWTILVEFLKPLVAVARKVLRTETNDNENKSNPSDNA